jgi:hypothetical protein
LASSEIKLTHYVVLTKKSESIHPPLNKWFLLPCQSAGKNALQGCVLFLYQRYSICGHGVPILWRSCNIHLLFGWVCRRCITLNLTCQRMMSCVLRTLNRPKYWSLIWLILRNAPCVNSTWGHAAGTRVVGHNRCNKFPVVNRHKERRSIKLKGMNT